MNGQVISVKDPIRLMSWQSIGSRLRHGFGCSRLRPSNSPGHETPPAKSGAGARGATPGAPGRNEAFAGGEVLGTRLPVNASRVFFFWGRRAPRTFGSCFLVFFLGGGRIPTTFGLAKALFWVPTCLFGPVGLWRRLPSFLGGHSRNGSWQRFVLKFLFLVSADLQWLGCHFISGKPSFTYLSNGCPTNQPWWAILFALL